MEEIARVFAALGLETAAERDRFRQWARPWLPWETPLVEWRLVEVRLGEEER